MVKKRKGSFAQASELAKTAGELPAATGTPDILSTRLQAVSKSRQTVPTTIRLVDPDECLIWERHNRNIDRLQQGGCQDLIDSFIAQGKQEVPAIVRRTGRTAKPTYEIICGARRFWTVQWLRKHNYPQFQYLIEIRNLTDEEAFRLSNLENLDRKDISDYERALDYKEAVKLYYDGKQAVMAERHNKSESWVSRYLKLAELPVEISEAYADLQDLKIHHGPQLVKLLDAKVTREPLLQQARALKAAHEASRKGGQKPMLGAAVLKSLLACARKRPAKRVGPIAEYAAGEYPAALAVKNKNQRSITFAINTQLGAPKKALVEAFKQALTDHYQ